MERPNLVEPSAAAEPRPAAQTALARSAITVLLAVACGACNVIGLERPTQPPVSWNVDVPVPIATNELVQQGGDGVTLFPASPTGAIVGVDYGYQMPPCGIRGLIDVDGSFWDAIDVEPSSHDYGVDNGTFRLISPIRATFTTPDRLVLHLERHRGSKTFGYCL